MPDISSILKELKANLGDALGGKLSQIILYGSYSRGDFTQYSDIDLLILMDGVLSKEEKRMADDLIAGYSLKYDVVISGLVYPAKSYYEFNTPFLQNVKEE